MIGGYAGKRVVVSGCASGIGAATARALVGQGARLLGLDRQPCEAGLFDFTALDLSDPASMDAAVAGIAGPIDVLFNCAGLAPTQPKMDVLKVNFLGTRHLTNRVAALMTNGGAIVSVSSNGGLRWQARKARLLEFLGQESFADGLAWLERHESEIANGYAFAKEALTTWTLRESAQLIKRGIRINCTSPGAVQTAMMREIEEKISVSLIDATTDPIGRRSSPEEQVGPLLFLGSDAASYVNGVDLAVDGGFAAKLALGE